MPIHRPKLKFREILRCRMKTQFVVVHHVAKLGRYSVQDIHQWHLNKKWAGIGYHYYVRKNGEIYQGRPRKKIGSHVYVNDKLKYNSRSILQVLAENVGLVKSIAYLCAINDFYETRYGHKKVVLLSDYMSRMVADVLQTVQQV